MRIAHVTDFYLPRLGGIELHVHDLAVRQRAAGHSVEVITSSPDGCRKGPAGRPAEEVRVRRVATGSAHPLLQPGAIAVRRMLRERRYDLVHVHAGLVSPLAFAAAATAGVTGTPTVVTLHSLCSYLEPAFGLLDTAVRWSSWPVVWTAVSDAAAEPLRRLVSPARVHVLPNGIDPASWRLDRVRADPGEVLVVAVMRLARRKRPLHLLRILRRARERLGPRPLLRAVVVGEGPRRRALGRYLDRHDMNGWVSLPGRLAREEIRQLYARADICVAPAVLESFGIAALEARCAGLPVVARTQGGIREFIVDGRSGLLADSDAGMVRAVVRLAREPATREAMMAHNRAVPPGISWEDVLRRTAEIYRIATGPRPARPADTGQMTRVR